MSGAVYPEKLGVIGGWRDADCRSLGPIGLLNLSSNPRKNIEMLTR